MFVFVRKAVCEKHPIKDTKRLPVFVLDAVRTFYLIGIEDRGFVLGFVLFMRGLADDP
jgi:hypothetical protein